MTSKIRLLPLMLIALGALLLAGCGSSSDTDSGAQTKAIAANDSTSDALFVSNGSEVLGRSATAFSDKEITSGTGAMHFSINMGQLAITGDADFAFEAPDKMHMVMKFGGGDQQSLLDLSEVGTFEILTRDGDVYMNIPILGGWYSFTPKDLGTSADDLQKLLARGSVIDYAALVNKLNANVTFVGREDVGGHSTVHYQFQNTLANLISSFSDALGASGDTGFAKQISDSQIDGPLTMDVWVGTDDYLPYKVTATASIYTGQTHFQMSLNGTFDNYNQPVTIPDAPPNAVPISKAFGSSPTPTPAP